MGLTPEMPVSASAGADRPLLVWCLVRDQRAHVEPIERHFGPAAEFVYDAAWDPPSLVRRRPDLVLCVNDYHYDVARCLEAARGAGIPSLVLQDGILEWRCQYENPLFGSGGGAAQHQPVLADRIACLGASSARQIAAWGNPGKPVATGMPRLDHILGRPPSPRRQPGRRVLVMTAKNPGFTPEQVAVTVRSLRDVERHLRSLPDVSVVWRTARNVAQELGVESEMKAAASEELTAILERVDAVVTTPSTAMLEAMLLDRPVAALDYHNAPRFVPTAWTISAPEHVAPVVGEILSPPSRKMAFQSDCLHDALNADGPAAPRVADLILEMSGRAATDASRPAVAARPAAALAELYPDEAIYRDTDLASLQAHLVRLKKQNAELREALQRFTLGRGLHTVGRRVAEYLRSRSRSS